MLLKPIITTISSDTKNRTLKAIARGGLGTIAGALPGNFSQVIRPISGGIFEANFSYNSFLDFVTY